MEDLSIQLEVLYSVDQEIFYVKDTLKKIPWFIEHGYPLEIIKLPAGIHETSTEKEIVDALNVEFREDDYKNCATSLQTKWKSVSGNFCKMKEVLAFQLKDEYRVILTKYGTGGSYSVKQSTVTVRVDSQTEDRTMSIVIHEIVHMTIQYLIDRYSVSHWYKERCVDLLVERYFPGLCRMQNPPKKDLSIVNQTFMELFPDIEEIAKKIGKG